MSILSTGFSRGTKGCHQQLGIPLHMVPPPTTPSLPLPLEALAVAKTWSPDSSEMALAFLSLYHFCHSALDVDCTCTSLKASHGHSHNSAT